ncbi:MAG: ABC transporter substrate-binding protein [Eubacteriales bacterium]|nr:ABC transporter substrate-binding protein [Eubacteriales bacterium]
MKMRKLLSLGVSFVLVCSLLAGCAGESGGGSADSGTQAVQESAKEDTDSVSSSDEEPYVVKIIAYGDGTTEAAKAVSEAISEKTRELYNIEVEIMKGYTVDQLNLMLTSGEKLDLFPLMTWEMSMSNLVSNGQLCSMTELLPEHASQTWESISEADWKCVTVNGEIYGVPMNKDKSSNSGFAIRKNVVDQLGIDVDAIKTLDDVEEVLTQVRDNTDYYPLVSSNGGLQGFLPCDDLGDGWGVLENIFDDDPTVVNWFETDTWTDLVHRMYDWNQKGLIMPDATSNTDSSMTTIGAVGCFTFGQLKPGVTRQASAEAGTELLTGELYPAVSTTNQVASCYCIPASCEQPEKAMQILDLLYNDPEVANLFTNGIEGEHWVYTDKENNVIDYPEGKDANSTGYTVFSWAVPNQMITPVREGDPLDLWDQLTEFNESAHNSIAKGFTWDNSAVLNEITACENVRTKYVNGLELGVLNPDETIPVFIEELKAAGIDTIIAEKQAQLDAWLAKNN